MGKLIPGSNSRCECLRPPLEERFALNTKPEYVWGGLQGGSTGGASSALRATNTAVIRPYSSRVGATVPVLVAGDAITLLTRARPLSVPTSARSALAGMHALTQEWAFRRDVALRGAAAAALRWGEQVGASDLDRNGWQLRDGNAVSYMIALGFSRVAAIAALQASGWRGRNTEERVVEAILTRPPE